MQENNQNTTIKILAIALLVALIAIVALTFALCSRQNSQPAPVASTSAAHVSSASSAAQTAATAAAPSANESAASDSATSESTASSSQSEWDEVTDDEPSTSQSSESASQTSSSSSEASAATPGNQASNVSVSEDGTYTSKDEVALYIHTYGHLPSNFISKSKARKAGWESKKGNLHEVLPGMSIGGSEFYNNEGQLPDAPGRTWTECDINYSGGYRGAERIVFSNDGLIFYTNDHYKTFEQLY